MSLEVVVVVVVKRKEKKKQLTIAKFLLVNFVSYYSKSRVINKIRKKKQKTNLNKIKFI
jgi:hypothetical protein